MIRQTFEVNRAVHEARRLLRPLPLRVSSTAVLWVVDILALWLLLQDWRR
jgi:hypothetical protein